MDNNVDLGNADHESDDVHRRRRAELAASDDLREVDAIIVSDLANVRYLTGFAGSNGAVLVWSEKARAGSGTADTICTDGRYTTQVAQQAPGLTAHIERDCPDALLRLAASAAPAEPSGADGIRVAIEGHVMTVAAYTALSQTAVDLRVTLRPAVDAVEALRIVKDATEVEFIASACAIGDDALAALVESGAIAPGRTERQVARDLEWAMFSRGAEAVAFETIVAAGAGSAVPHHRPTDAVLEVGDLVKIDFGAVFGGYHSDMTRTFVLGEPAAWQREIYDVVARAQRVGREALAAGADLAGIDAAARKVIGDAGYGDEYVHGLGHGVGLQIHEAPGIGASATGTLPDGATVTVEPGIYLPGRGGVRIEDTLVVTDAGPRSLTTTPRELRAL